MRFLKATNGHYFNSECFLEIYIEKHESTIRFSYPLPTVFTDAYQIIGILRDDTTATSNKHVTLKNFIFDHKLSEFSEVLIEDEVAETRSVQQEQVKKALLELLEECQN